MRIIVTFARCFFTTMSTVLKRYTVHFKGLKTGKHIFNFDVDRTFFEQFEGSLVSNGNLKVEVELDKHTDILKFSIFIEGNVDVLCDRCLEGFSIPTQYEGQLAVRISDAIEGEENDDDIWYVSSNENEVSLAQYIYESICLSLPIKRYHGMLGTSIEGCDKEMLKKLNMLSNGPEESRQKPPADARWDKLKDIYNN